MSADIVQLKRTEDKEPRIWTCAHCHSQVFYLYEDGSTECRMCGFVGHDNGGWAETLKPRALDPDIPKRDITDYETADLARARVVKSADQDTAIIAVLWPDGRLRVWSIFDHKDSPARQEWIRSATGAVASLILGEPNDLGELPKE